jgi:predicted phosphate transport protein (TIGR00153 family)
MSLNNVFQFFVPKDKKFFPLFEKGSANIVKLGEKLLEAVNTEDLVARKAIYKEIEQLEHVGDEITHQIFLELGKNFITPFDREDIHRLASAIDDIADYIHGSANRMLLYNVTDITDPIRKLCELILKSVIDLDKAIRELRNMRNMRAIADACVRINSIENQADDVFDKAVSQLFDYEKDAVTLIKYKEVLFGLETATDKCEDAANVLESILIKHA